MQRENPSDHCLSVICPDPEHLQPLASVLAALLQPGDVLLLYGPLGAGKTTFTQALARELGVGEDQYVSSPSFALLHEYQGHVPIAHMDLYRLEDEDDVEAAGLLDYLGQEAVTIVEWPERLGDLTPDSRLEIVIEPLDATHRRLRLIGHGAVWQERFVQFRAQLVQCLGLDRVSFCGQ